MAGTRNRKNKRCVTQAEKGINPFNAKTKNKNKNTNNTRERKAAEKVKGAPQSGEDNTKPKKKKQEQGANRMGEKGLLTVVGMTGRNG